MTTQINFPQINEMSMSMLGTSSILCILLPLICVIYALIKMKKTFIPFLYGLALYFITQIIISLLGTGIGYLFGQNASISIYLVFNVLTSIIEEVARFICLIHVIKKYKKWHDAFMYGLGYGVPAVFFNGAMVSFNNLIIAASINSGAVNELSVSEMQAFADAAASISTLPPIGHLLISIDQICILAMSVALSIFLWEGLNANNKHAFTVTATIRIMAMCAPVLFNTVWKWGFLASSLFLLIIAGFSIWYIIKTRKPSDGMPNFKII